MMSATANPQVVLVTGAAGWLGSRLVESLITGLPDQGEATTPLAGVRVRCLVLPGQEKSIRGCGDSLEVLTGDLRNPADCDRLCAGAEGAILYHTAGIIHPRRVSEFYAINVNGTRNLMAAATEARVKRAVVVSSNSPCGCNPHPDHLFDEMSPYRPYMNYGRSKQQMEQVVRGFQMADKMETVLIRPPWFYGPNQPPRQTLFFQMIRQGKAPIVGSGENLRSMSYVDNLCQGLRLAGSAPHANGQTYWIADRRPYAMTEIIDTVEKVLENQFNLSCAHKRMHLPGIASSLAWLADKGLQSLGGYHQKIHVLSEMNKTIACSVTKAEKELGYRPGIALEEGMRRSIAWCLDQGLTI